MSASLKEPQHSQESSPPEEKKVSKENKLTLVDPTETPYYVSQFEKNPRGWVWDLLLGLYILAVIAFVVFIELKS